MTRNYRTLQDEIRGRVLDTGGYPGSWPQHQTCPCCASRSIRESFVKYGLSHWECGRCRFVFANPHPTESFLKELYNGSYMTAVRQYVEIPKARAGRDDAYQSMAGHFYVEIAEYIRRRCTAGTVLDVGGGTGTFLHRLRQSNPRLEVTLNELNRESMAFAREVYNLDVCNLSPRRIAATGRRFDVVTSIACLEHQSHPERMLRELVELVKPGGLLFLNLPNFSPLCRLLSRGDSAAVTAPFHLSLFNRYNLRLLMKRMGGVRVDEVWETGPEAFYFVHLARINECEDILVPTAETEALKSELRRAWTAKQERWVPRLQRLDRVAWLKRLIRQLDGQVYLNLAATRLSS